MKCRLIVVLAELADGLVEESETCSGLLIHDRSNGRPLRGPAAGAAQAKEADWYAGYVQLLILAPRELPEHFTNRRRSLLFSPGKRDMRKSLDSV